MWNTINKLILLLALLWVGPKSNLAFANSSLSIRLQQSQYITDSSVAQQTSSYSHFSPQLYTQGSFFNRKVKTLADLNAILPVSNEDDFQFWFPSVYLQFDPKNERSTLTRDTKVTFGRAIKNWSSLDSDWGIGLWQPQMRWDYISPQQMGLTGLFYETEKAKLKFTAFASGLHLPDQNANFEVEDGEFVSSNRWFRPPVSRLQIVKGTSEIDYKLDKPEVADVVFNSSFGFSLRAGGSKGLWGQIAAADKPSNQFHVAIDGENALNLSTNKTEPTVHPILVRHRLSTAEFGFKGYQSQFYASATHESYEKPRVNSKWEQAPLTDAIYYGGGAKLQFLFFQSPSEIFSGFVVRDEIEDKKNDNSFSDSLNSSVQRLQFKRMAHLGFQKPFTKSSGSWSTQVKYTHSLDDRADWLSAKIQYRPAKDWTLYLGGDVLGSPENVKSKDMSFISKYRDNDRIEGGFTHVF